MTASPSAVASKPFDIESYFTNLLCPVEKIPLTQAVSFVPCMHKVNATAAQTLYGTVVNDGCSLSGKPCVVCKQTVKAYYADHTIRDLVTRLIGDNNLKNFAKELPKSSLIIEAKKEQAEIPPYPGKAAKFVHTSGNWSYYNSGGILRHIMEFQSVQPGSLLREFSLLGDDDNGIRLSVSFAKDVKFDEYLQSFEIPMDAISQMTGHFIASTIENVRKLFKIVCLNNEIPQEFLEKLKAIIERGTARPSST